MMLLTFFYCGCFSTVHSLVAELEMEMMQFKIEFCDLSMVIQVGLSNLMILYHFIH